MVEAHMDDCEQRLRWAIRIGYGCSEKIGVLVEKHLPCMGCRAKISW